MLKKLPKTLAKKKFVFSSNMSILVSKDWKFYAGPRTDLQSNTKVAMSRRVSALEAFLP